MAAVWHATGSPARSPAQQPAAPQRSPKQYPATAPSPPWRPPSASPGISPIQSPSQPAPVPAARLRSAARRSLAAALRTAPQQQQRQQQQRQQTIKAQPPRSSAAAAALRSSSTAAAPSPERLSALAAPKARPGAATTAATRPRVQAAFGRTLPSNAWVPVKQQPPAAALSSLPPATFSSPQGAAGSGGAGAGSPHAPWQSPVHAELAQLTGNLRSLQAELAARSVGVFSAGTDALQLQSPHSPMRQAMQPGLPVLGQASPTRNSNAPAAALGTQVQEHSHQWHDMAPGASAGAMHGYGRANLGSPDQRLGSAGRAPAILLDARPPTAPLQQPSSPSRLPPSPLRPSPGLATTGGSSGQWHVAGQPRSTALSAAPVSALERLAAHETTSFSFKRAELSALQQQPQQQPAWGAPSTGQAFQDSAVQPTHSRPAAPSTTSASATAAGDSAQAAAMALAVPRPGSSTSPLPDPRAQLSVVPSALPSAAAMQTKQSAPAARAQPAASTLGTDMPAPGVVRFGLLPRKSNQTTQPLQGMAGSGGEAGA